MYRRHVTLALRDLTFRSRRRRLRHSLRHRSGSVCASRFCQQTRYIAQRRAHNDIRPSRSRVGRFNFCIASIVAGGRFHSRAPRPVHAMGIIEFPVLVCRLRSRKRRKLPPRRSRRVCAKGTLLWCDVPQLSRK